MIQLHNDRIKNSGYSETAEEYIKLAGEVADLPEDQLERAVVLAATLPKSYRATATPEVRKAQVLFLDALARRYPFVEDLLKEVNLYKVFSSLSMGGPSKGYEKILAAVDKIDAIDGGRFTLAVMEKYFCGGAEEPLLQEALQRHPSSTAVFAAYRDAHQKVFPWGPTATLRLDGEMFEGAGQLLGLTCLTLFGIHTGTDHLDELKALAPFHVNYLVRSPKLANLLPLHAHIKSLTLHKSCADYTPLLQFESLKHLVVVDKDLAKVFALLGRRPGLRIDKSGSAHSDSASALLRAEYASVIQTP